jgi:hypothetical protein
MKIFDWLPLLRRHSGAGCACTAVTDMKGRAQPRTRLAMAREACVIALAQRLCVDMPLLIDSLPSEPVRAPLIGPDEVRHD